MSKVSEKLRFVGVTVTYGELDFSLVFMHPYSLSMRRFVPLAGEYRPLRPVDWLVCDFPFLLSRRLSLSKPELLSVNVYSFSRGEFHDSFPVYQGNSLPSSWVDPFVDIIASTFLNSFIHGTKSR